MGTINLTAEPEFKLKVKIPRLGQDSVEVEFSFQHRSEDEFDQLDEQIQKPEFLQTKDEGLVQLVAKGWELKDAWTVENIRLLCQNYPGAAYAIWRAYRDEYQRARLGN